MRRVGDYCLRGFALCRAFLIETRSNVTVFILTLVLPSLLFVVNNAPYIGMHVGRSATFGGLASYLSYIIFTSIWNYVAYPSLEMREHGLLKQLTYAAGSARIVLMFNAFAQILVITIQVLLFMCVAQVFMGYFDIVLVAMALSGVVFGVPVMMLCAVALRVRIPPQTMNVCMIIVIVFLFFGMDIPSKGLWMSLALTVNPLRFLCKGMVSFASILSDISYDSSDLIALSMVAVLYGIVGIVSLYRIDIRPLFDGRVTGKAILDPGKDAGNAEVNVIIGPNGVGKTTMMDAFGERLAKGGESRFSRRKVSYLLQRPRGFETLTVGQTIALYQSMDGGAPVPMEQVLQYFRQHHLQPIWDSRVYNLSGGESQMLLTYCACVLNRDVYLFDEPTEGVDPTNVVDMLAMIRSLAHDCGRRVFITMHHMEQIGNLGDSNVVVLRRDGRVMRGRCSSLSQTRDQTDNRANDQTDGRADSSGFFERLVCPNDEGCASDALSANVQRFNEAKMRGEDSSH